MNTEQGGFQETKHETGANRLVKSAEAMIKPLFRTEIVGAEKFKEIPEGKKVIFATSHMTEYDVPIAIAVLGENYKNKDLKVVDQDSHHRFVGGEKPVFLGLKIAGMENFHSVDVKGIGKERISRFNPDNFGPIKESLESDNPVVIASYLDVAHKSQKWELPDRIGNGAAYLAQITEDAVVVPVAIDIQADKPFGMGELGIKEIIKNRRPRVNVVVGSPIELEKIEGIDEFAEFLRKRASGEEATDEEKERFKEIKTKLQDESGQIVDAIADLLPEEKRGHWGTTQGS